MGRVLAIIEDTFEEGTLGRYEILGEYERSRNDYTGVETRELWLIEAPFAKFLPDDVTWERATKSQRDTARAAAKATIEQARLALAERPFDDSGPVISPRTKALVESGLERDVFQYASNDADTLRPESFDSAVEEPRMILATDETWSDVEERLGERLLRD